MRTIDVKRRAVQISEWILIGAFVGGIWYLAAQLASVTHP